MGKGLFSFDEETLAFCFAFLENKSAGANEIPPDCRALMIEYYHVGNHGEHIQSFLKSIESGSGRNSHRSLGSNQYASEMGSDAHDTHHNVRSIPSQINKDAWFELWNDENWERHTLFEENMLLMRLHDEESIRKAANLHNATLSDDIPNRRLHHHYRPDKTIHSPFVKDSPHLQIAPDSGHGITSSRRKQRQEKDAFNQYLNWASDQNPDGVNIVHPAHDQGSCGSCWGWAATGTLEASASRRIAFQAYQTVVQSSNSKSITGKRNLRRTKHQNGDRIQVVDDETHNRAVMLARVAEQQAIDVAELSVQELVDCDTYADQGCVGGNPLLAFYFIHRYGLTSAAQYPYTGQEEACRLDLVSYPIASVQSWGILTPNHEDNMESVLRQLGPIAVGIDGADPAFMSYSEGIFESTECDQTANHALLIVGHGHEVDKYGRTIKYWIARNSWGPGWGENGFVRIKRGSGRKGEEGVCGIARSPSVALGGVLLPQSGIESTDATYQTSHHLEKMQRIETSLVHSYCDSFGLGDVQICDRFESYFESHRLILYCAVLLVCGIILVFPLRMARLNLRQRQLRLMEGADRAQERPVSNNGESTPLLRLEVSLNTYGV